MLRASLKGPRLVGVFLLGCALFNYPLLFLFNHPSQILGIPLLYAYIFLAWLLLIGLMAWVLEARRDPG